MLLYHTVFSIATSKQPTMFILSSHNVIRVAGDCRIDPETNTLINHNSFFISVSELLHVQATIPVEVAYGTFKLVSYKFVFEKRPFVRCKLSNNYELILPVEYKDIDSVRIIPIVQSDTAKQVRTSAPQNKAQLVAKSRTLINQGVFVYYKASMIVNNDDAYQLRDDGYHVSIVSKEIFEEPLYVIFDAEFSVIDCLYLL